MARKRIRRRVLAVRVTIDEMTLTKRLAAAQGLDVATYLRDLIDREGRKLAAEHARASNANTSASPDASGRAALPNGSAKVNDAPALQAAA